MKASEIERLRQRLRQRSEGEFHYPELYGLDWDRLSIGARVRYGREFLEAVRKGVFPGVEDTGRKKGGGRLYIWTGEE